MNKNQQIPFHLTEQSLSDWLLGLSLERNDDSCRQLMATLQAFRNIDLSPQQLLTFLPKIGEKLEMVVDKLERNYLDNGFPLSADEQAIADLTTLAFATLAEQYVSLARQLFEHANDFDNRQKSIALYLSLQALGQSLLSRKIVYSPIAEGFWLTCYQIYRWAENAQFLDSALVSGKQDGGSIKTQFNRILLFELSNPGQFRPQIMKEIYKALWNCSTSSLIEADSPPQSLHLKCIFNLSKDQGPQRVFSPHPLNEVDSETRYFSSVIAAKNLNELLQQQFSLQNTVKSITYSSFSKAIKSLSLTQKRKFNRKTEQLNKTCIVGFNPIISYLFKINRIDPEKFTHKPQKAPRVAGKWEVPDLDLVPMDDESSYQIEALFNKKIADNSQIISFLKANREFSKNRSIWDSAEIEKNKRADTIPAGECEVIDSNAQGFQILWKSPTVKVKVGEILALPTDKKDSVEIGLIRRISNSSQKGLCLGVEIIGLKAEARCLVKPYQPEQTNWAIFLPGIPALKQEDSIIYNSSDLSTGEFIDILQGDLTISCRLKKLINSTSAITQMELYYTSSL